MKRFGIIVLSILVLYAGVVGALEKCLDHESHADHLASETHHDPDSFVGHSHASDDSSALIHCASPAHRVELAANTATASYSDQSEGTLFISFDAIPAVSSGLSGPVSLRKILTFSFHAGIPHYLFLSVLHI